MHGTLTKVFSVHANLRTTSVTGDFENLPTVGERFNLIGQSLTEGDFMRLVTTSPVVMVWKIPGTPVVCFKTENSVYGLSVTEVTDDAPSAN